VRGSETEHRQHNVLIVDDAPANVRLLSQMLTAQGFKVRAATSGERALEAMRSAPADLVLLDVRMPGMSGYEVCQQLKRDGRTSEVPVIFISALQDLSDKMLGFAAGGVDYVTKPFQVEEVLARIQTHLALRDLQTQLQEANRRLERELALAGRVQTSLLPKEVPELPGWDLAVTLRPARQTSGDYYDLIRLRGDRLGIVMADVVDKGAGAALYMALTCTLLRTYAAEPSADPAQVLSSVNHRLLMDMAASEFVTVFYGVLDPPTGELVYANAGHHPPYVFKSGLDEDVRTLERTGLPLGIFEDGVWDRRSVQLAPEDVLLLYTDGITDSQDQRGRFFGAERLLASAAASRGESAQVMQERIWLDVDAFAGDAPQRDDMALMVVSRLRLSD
jgi:serine phosphatase RsbU (regulator of sigma subunit)